MVSNHLGYVLLFVKNVAISADFYGKLFNLKPVELAPTFALFVLGNGVKLGLWSRYTAEPLVMAEPGAVEICFNTDNVDEAYDQWGKLGIAVAQAPTDMDFGRTFVALDPDGHRIRVLKLHSKN